jgi:hypothetical protein
MIPCPMRGEPPIEFAAVGCTDEAVFSPRGDSLEQRCGLSPSSNIGKRSGMAHSWSWRRACEVCALALFPAGRWPVKRQRYRLLRPWSTTEVQRRVKSAPSIAAREHTPLSVRYQDQEGTVRFAGGSRNGRKVTSSDVARATDALRHWMLWVASILSAALRAMCSSRTDWSARRMRSCLSSGCRKACGHRHFRCWSSRQAPVRRQSVPSRPLSCVTHSS